MKQRVRAIIEQNKAKPPAHYPVVKPHAVRKPREIPYDTMSQRTAHRMTLENPAVRIGGFAKALRAFVKREFDAETAAEITNLGFNPDAYIINEDTGELVIYEIEDTHKISTRKLDILINLFFWFDEIGLTLRLIVTDRYGQNQREIDLDACYRATPEAQALETASPEALSWLASCITPDSMKRPKVE